MPPALTSHGGGMDPVDGHLLANLPDLGVKQEVRVNDGLLGGNPHSGVLHLHIHGFGLVNLHTHSRSHICYINTLKNVSAPANTPGPETRHCPAFALFSLEQFQPCSSIYHLCVFREESILLTPDTR